MRKLASIQVITDLQPIPNADAIEVATILGWKVVVKKGEFKAGYRVVYVEIDSLLPARPEFDFLANKHYRIKTIRLRGQLSQGICFPLSILPDWVAFESPIGSDVTEILGITKYEPPIPACLAGDVRGNFPGMVPKTDETRIQSAVGLLEEMQGLKVYITEKIDGSSGTFVSIEGDVHVCSRNLSLKDTPGNIFWSMYRKYDLEKLFAQNQNLAIQGEVAGPGIQKNPLKLKEHEFFVFNVFEIKEGQYYGLDFIEAFCKSWNLQTVPILGRDVTFNFDLPQLLAMAEGKYASGVRREGIVVRPMQAQFSKALNSRMSFKVISNEYLLKEED